MLKEHRATRARTLGGAAAVAALLAGGLALASPGFAREETPRATIRPIVLKAAAHQAPIITDEEIETLVEKCASAQGERDARKRGVIVCDNGRAVDDPEVRRIVDKALDRAKVQVRAAELTAEQADRIAEAAERAARIEPQDMERHMKHAREALEAARVTLASTEFKKTRLVAMEAALAGARATVVARSALTREQIADIEAALAEARAEIDVDISEEMKELDEHLREEMDRLKVEID